MYRIRVHGCGAQGIKTASQILGSVLLRKGFEVQDAPRHGSDHREAFVFAYVRAACAPIHERGVIAHPDLVVVADNTRIAIPAAGVLQGATERCAMLVTGAEPPEVWNERVKFSGTVIALPGASTPDIGIGARCSSANAQSP